MRTAFITSTGRTGTDFFTHLFNHVVEGSWSTHEPKPAYRRRSYRFLSEAPTWWDVNYFRFTRHLMNHSHYQPWYVETNYHLFSATDMLRQAFPDCLTVHIIRDGRDVVRSWLNRGRYIVDDHITPFHLPDDPAQELWEDWNAVQRLAWYWKTINRTAEVKAPDLILRFEDIFNKRENSAIFKILERMDGIHYERERVLEALGAKVNQSVNPFIPKFPQWPELWQRQFVEVAGEEMRRLGYME